MNANLRARLAQGWCGQGVIIGAVLLTLGVSFCLFDADEAGSAEHAMTPDHCLGLLVLSLMVVSLLRLPFNGWAVAYRIVHVRATPLHTPTPPPKFTRF